MTDDRPAFLAAIAADPADDTARLAYADWLDEHGASDADAATAEFVRLACGRKRVKDRQSVPEGRWLHTQWPRLVPALWAKGVRLMRREGRWVHGWVDVPRRLADGRPIPHPEHVRAWVVLEFWRGFVRRVQFYTGWACGLLLPALVADQPLAGPEFADLSLVPVEGPAGFDVLFHLRPLGLSAEDVFRAVGESFDTLLVGPHAVTITGCRTDVEAVERADALVKQVWRHKALGMLAGRTAREPVAG